MTYNVFSGPLNPTHFTSLHLLLNDACSCVADISRTVDAMFRDMQSNFVNLTKANTAKPCVEGGRHRWILCVSVFVALTMLVRHTANVLLGTRTNLK